jgi:hypothetical protein
MRCSYVQELIDRDVLFKVISRRGWEAGWDFERVERELNSPSS